MNLKDVLEKLSADPKYVIIGGTKGADDKRCLEGSKMLDKSSALLEIYTKLGFTQYIDQRNFDGLDELLSPDLWQQEKDLHICIADSEKFISTVPEADLKTLLEVFESAGQKWDIDKGTGSFSLRLLA